MIKTEKTLSQVKEIIGKMYLKPVEVEFCPGRNKTVRFCGKLSGVYPALFTVLPENKEYKGKTSYSYSEYMCGKVKLKTLER